MTRTPYRLLLVLLLLPWLGLRAGEMVAPPTEGAKAKTLKVLFIGNSLTYTNNLPKMLAALAKAGGQPELEYETEVPGGFSLEQHWQGGKALAKLKAKPWDYVVLQDNSTQPQKNPQAMVTAGKQFAAAILEQKAKPAWYMTWAWIDKLETQPVITKAYRDLAEANGGLLVPAGVAMGAYRQAHPEQKLVTDNRHPDLAGTYLVACVFYGALYQTSPVGLPGAPAKLDADRARALQEAAWAAVQAKP